MTFAEWLTEELNKREWSNSDLAKKAGLSRQVIGYYLEGRIPDNKAIKKIARAFDIPEAQVFRVAGLLSDREDIDEEIEQAIHILREMSANEKALALRILSSLSPPKKRDKHAPRGRVVE